MKQIKVKLVRSRIGTTPHQRKMLDSLGLKKLNSERIFNDTPSIRGIVNKLPHLVSFSEVIEETSLNNSSNKSAPTAPIGETKVETIEEVPVEVQKK